MGHKPHYKQPKIVRAKRGWFIALYYLLPDGSDYKRFELSGGINYIHDLEQREKEIQSMLKYLKKELERGFNPFLPDLAYEFQEKVSEKKNDILKAEMASYGWDILTALQRYKEDCIARNLADRTLTTYESFINNFKDWILSLEKHEMRASEFLRSDVVEFLDTYYDEEDWKPRTYNNHVDFLRMFFKRIQQLEKRENPEIKYAIELTDLEEKKDRAEKNRYYTPMVAARVKTELEKDRDLYNYVKWIFYSCMRPREIRLLQVKHIDLNARQIKAIAPTSKTGDRFVPICDELLEMIKEMDIIKCPLNYYIFGRSGKISPHRRNKDGFSVKYRPIKEKLGLDDKYTLYGWKHTRVVNLLMAGFSDQEVMSLTGHRDYQGFMAYKRDLIIDAKAMKGKTIDF